MSQPIIGQGGHFVFPIQPEKHKLGRGRCDLASYQVSSNSFHSFRGEVENVSANQRPFCFFPIGLKNTNVVEGIESLLLSSFAEFRLAVSEEKSKMSQPIRGQGGNFVFPISPKNKNFVEGIEILLPIKFY